jgi:hypothetical protein
MALDLFVSTPLYDGKLHYATVAGWLQTLARMGSDKVGFAARPGSFLPRLRDLLTADFLNSGARYWLAVDADIGFSYDDVAKLVDAANVLVADREFVCGAYARKQVDGRPVCAYNGAEQGILKGADFVGAGFLLLPRAGILRMVEQYKDLAYPGDAIDPKNGVAVGLWSPFCAVRDANGAPRYLGEDYSFSERWRQMGGKIWVHPGVKLRHYGESVYTLLEGA